MLFGVWSPSAWAEVAARNVEYADLPVYLDADVSPEQCTAGHGSLIRNVRRTAAVSGSMRPRRSAALIRIRIAFSPVAVVFRRLGARSAVSRAPLGLGGLGV